MDINVEIKTKLGRVKYFRSLVTDLDEEKNTPNHLKSLMWSAYYAYLLSDEDLLWKILRLFESFDFDGNYDKWTWVEGGLVLLAKEYKKLGYDEKSDIVIKKILSTLDFGDSDIKKRIFKKAFYRRLEREELITYQSKIEESKCMHNEELLFMYLMGYYMNLIFIYEMGGSESCSLDYLVSQINDTKENLKSILE